VPEGWQALANRWQMSGNIYPVRAPAHASRWLRHDLPHRAEQFGLPLTVVTAQQSERPLPAAASAEFDLHATAARLLRPKSRTLAFTNGASDKPAPA
jgi:hypothetical protein